MSNQLELLELLIRYAEIGAAESVEITKATAEVEELANQLRAYLYRTEQTFSITRLALDHPVECPTCKHSFLPYIDPREIRGLSPSQLWFVLKEQQ